jgi:excisionase family DNA binding protein
VFSPRRAGRAWRCCSERTTNAERSGDPHHLACAAAPTLPEVVTRTGISERTLHRRIHAGELRREYRRIPNRKPLSVLDPQDVTKLEQTILHPVPTETLPAKLPQPDMAALLAGLGMSGVPLRRKLYLTLTETAQLSGLPKSYIRRCIKDGSLKVLKAGGWKTRRVDLEKI